mgnify:CR=1 FL=1
MKTIGIFYATLTKTTVGIVDEIEFFLKKDDFKTFNVKNGVKEIENFENLIFVTPTYQVGEAHAAWMNNLKKLAKENGFNVVDKAITNGTELLAAANIISKEIDIYYATQDNTVASYFAALLDVLNKAKVPVFATNDVYSNAGAFISQGTTDYGIGYRSGEIAAEILLKGKKPSDFPIETVKDLQIKVSKSNMEFLGIKLPKDVESQVIFTK